MVGDPDQTIYTFTGASADYLTDFADRWPGAHTVRLTTNYRSTPQVLALANRLIAGKGLTSVAAAGPEPEIVTHRSGEAELAAIVAAVPRLLSQGVAASEIAILVRTNAQLVPVEAALTRAGLPFTVRGTRFHARPEVRAARLALRRTDAGGGSLTDVIAARWRTELGVDVEIEPDAAAGAEARERHASLVTLFAIARELEFSNASASVATFLPSSTGGTRPRSRPPPTVRGSRSRPFTAPRASSGTPSSCRCSRRAACRSARPSTIPPRWPRSGACSTWHHARADPPRAVVGREPGERQGPADAGKAVPLPGAAPRRRGGRAGPQRIRADRAGPPFVTGDRVSHVRHGVGTVSGGTRSSVSVRFDNGVTGNLSPSSLDLVGEAPMEPEDQALLDALTAWRLERSRADGVPAYVVADNKTLAAIAVARPRSEGELLAMPGIGPAEAGSVRRGPLRIIGGE